MENLYLIFLLSPFAETYYHYQVWWCFVSDFLNAESLHSLCFVALETLCNPWALVEWKMKSEIRLDEWKRPIDSAGFRNRHSPVSQIEWNAFHINHYKLDIHHPIWTNNGSLEVSGIDFCGMPTVFYWKLRKLDSWRNKVNDKWQ